MRRVTMTIVLVLALLHGCGGAQDDRAEPVFCPAIVSSAPNCGAACCP